VNRQLLRLLSTYILVEYRLIANYNINLSNFLYHWQLSMASFRLCETCLLHIKPFVVSKSAMFSFLGGAPPFASSRGVLLRKVSLPLATSEKTENAFSLKREDRECILSEARRRGATLWGATLWGATLCATGVVGVYYSAFRGRWDSKWSSQCKPKSESESWNYCSRSLFVWHFWKETWKGSFLIPMRISFLNPNRRPSTIVSWFRLPKS